MTGAAGFAVNILAEDQEECRTPSPGRSEDRFAAVDWRHGPHGSPVLDGVAAWFDCAMHEVIDAGDHVILDRPRSRPSTNGGPTASATPAAPISSPAPRRKAVSAAAQGEAVVGAVVERDGAVLLLGPDEGPLSLPEAPIDEGRTTRRRCAASCCGPRPADVTSASSIRSTRTARPAASTSSIAAIAGAGEPTDGRFVPLADVPLERIVRQPRRATSCGASLPKARSAISASTSATRRAGDVTRSRKEGLTR